MSRAHPGRRFSLCAYRSVRIFVRILAVLFLLLLLMFVLLRTVGVPDPLLREVLRRVNAAGIPVDADKVTLTIRGWRADNLRYYSSNPDDLAPVLNVGEVYFKGFRRLEDASGALGWSIRLIAAGAKINPPLGWGVAIPEKSPVRTIERLETSLALMSDQVRFDDGKLVWLGSRFEFNGTFLRAAVADEPEEALAAAPSESGMAVAAVPSERRVVLSGEQFAALENQLKKLSLPAGAEVDVDFLLDAADFSASRIELSAMAENPALRGVAFSEGSVEASFAWPVLQVQNAQLERDLQAVRLSGEYDFVSGIVGGELFNSVTSTELMLLLPEWIHGRLPGYGVQVTNMPRLEMDFGPAPVNKLADHLSGSFSVRGLTYKGLMFEVLRGQLQVSEPRIELEQLDGLLRGQEERAAQVGSAMRGGPLTGSAFFNRETAVFGFAVKTGFDPHLLKEPLEYSPAAVQNISRFHHKNEPPRLHVECGANLKDWSGFYINIGGTATDVAYEGVVCDSLNCETSYTNRTLRVDPLLCTKNSRYVKGWVEIDYFNSLARFDVASTMDPADVEQMINPALDFFGTHLDAAGGSVLLQAHGRYDWSTMQQTDLTAQLKADRFRMPFIESDQFEAQIRCVGPALSVTNMHFGLCGGSGGGAFSVELDPAKAARPYSLDLQLKNVGFRQYCSQLYPDKKITASGKMNGRIQLAADFSTNFYAAATGGGKVKIKDGQLADLPLFKDFSRLMRKIIPGFDIFSITKLSGTFTIGDGRISSSDAYFGGNLISADGQGSYSPEQGYDAYIQVQILSETVADKVMRFLTYPVSKFLEIRLEGPFENPSWRLKRFPKEISDLFRVGPKTSKE